MFETVRARPATATAPAADTRDIAARQPDTKRIQTTGPKFSTDFSLVPTRALRDLSVAPRLAGGRPRDAEVRGHAEASIGIALGQARVHIGHEGRVPSPRTGAREMPEPTGGAMGSPNAAPARSDASEGAPLDDFTRDRMEQVFETDLGAVRIVHSDATTTRRGFSATASGSMIHLGFPVKVAKQSHGSARQAATTTTRPQLAVSALQVRQQGESVVAWVGS